MNIRDKKIKKAPREQDLGARLYFLRIAGLAVPFLCLLGFYIGYTRHGVSGAVSGFLLAAAGGLILSVAVYYLLDAVGSASGILFGRKRALWTTREQVQGLVSQARFNKDNQEFKAAFDTINQVLKRDPHYPAALFLKAQILWHGFEDAASARSFLEKILSLPDSDRMTRLQASSLRDDLAPLGGGPAKNSSLQGLHIGLAKYRPPLFSRLSHIFFEDLKEKIEETPVSRGAIGITIIFAFLSLLLAVLMNVQLDTLENKSRQTCYATKQVQGRLSANADRLQQSQTALKKMVSQTMVINQSLAPERSN